MQTKSVSVSGTVGKQVYAVATDKVVLKGFLLAALSAAARVVIRDGNASGTVEFEQSVVANGSAPVKFTEQGQRFDKGMHVKVLGTGAVCYLFID